MTVNGALRGYEHSAIVPDSTHAILWFSDIAGFSDFSRNLPPDEAARQIRRFMDIQVEAIHEAGGEVDKFMGDGLMAFWRVPDDHRVKDRVPRAVAAALAATKQLRKIVKDEGLGLDIRIGLHMGPVVIGDFGGKERIAYTLIGETVNSASRFEQVHTDIDGLSLGPIRISETLFAHVADPDTRALFDSKPRSFTVKGSRVFAAHTSLE